MCDYTDGLNCALRKLRKGLRELKETVTNSDNNVMINPLKSDDMLPQAAAVHVIKQNRRST